MYLTQKIAHCMQSFALSLKSTFCNVIWSLVFLPSNTSGVRHGVNKNVLGEPFLNDEKHSFSHQFLGRFDRMRGLNELFLEVLYHSSGLNYSPSKGTVSGGNNPRVSGTEFLFTSEHQQNYFFVVAKVFKGIWRPEGAVLQEGNVKSLTDRMLAPHSWKQPAYEMEMYRKARRRANVYFDGEFFSLENLPFQGPLSRMFL